MRSEGKETDKWVLVQFDKNWADEFDVRGFQVMTLEEWNIFKYKMEKCVTYPKEAYFGTNEGWDIESPDKIVRCYTTKEITFQEVEFLREKLFSRHYDSYGEFIDITEDIDEEFYTQVNDDENNWCDFVGIEKANEIIAKRLKK